MECHQSSPGPPPFFSSSFAAEVRLVRSTRSGTGICKVVSIAALQRHADKHVDDVDGTCIHALDGRAGLLAGTEDGIIRLQHSLDGEGEGSAPDGDGEGAGDLVLVLLVSTAKVLSACLEMLLW